jgi:hypothetical protein
LGCPLARFDGKSESLGANPVRQLHEVALSVLVTLVHLRQENAERMKLVVTFAHTPNRFRNLGNGFLLCPYELAGDRTVVAVADGKLYLTRGTRPRTELIPEACDIFCRKGIEGRILFRRRANGKVDSVIDRRNNEDIVWKRSQ